MASDGHCQLPDDVSIVLCTEECELTHSLGAYRKIRRQDQMDEIQNLLSVKGIKALQASTLYGSGLVDFSV